MMGDRNFREDSFRNRRHPSRNQSDKNNKFQWASFFYETTESHPVMAYAPAGLQDYVTNEFVLPWVYLHAIKDYTDMAYHLEMHPQTKAVVNFVPVLLDQLRGFQRTVSDREMRCPLLRLLAMPDLDQITMQDRLYVFDSCFLSNHSTMLNPYPAYKRLHELYEVFSKHGECELAYFSGQYLGDLLVWYHLAWMGESVRRNNEFMMRLMAQSQGFSYEDRLLLFKSIGELISDLIPRYRKLMETGQIELSTTPHYHPLAPLLIDFSSARDSQPDIELPEHPCYSGGRSRVAFHISSAICTHTRRFNEKRSVSGRRKVRSRRRC